MTHDDPRWLEDLLTAQSAQPRDLPLILNEFGTHLASSPQAAEALAAITRADYQRHVFAAEDSLFQRFGWRLMRPLLALGLIAAPVFIYQKGVDPTLGYALFVAGAGAFYGVLQVYLFVWSRRREKLREVAEQKALQALGQLARTGKEFVDTHELTD